MNGHHVVVEKIDRVAVLRMNQPDTRNALSPEVKRDLLAALEEVEEDDHIRAVVLTGEGKAFCAGGNLSTMKDMKLLDGRKRMQGNHRLIFQLLEMEKPVIAAVNGAAAGAGFSLALLCDMIVAEEQSVFVQSFVHVGLIPDLGGLHFLPLLLGPHKAKELMFLGERVTAEEAHRIGIVNRLAPKERLLEEAAQLAAKLAHKAPLSIGFMKKIMNQHLHRDLKTLLELEAQGQELCFQTEDYKEGLQAFFAKRQPEFKGR